MAQSKSRHSFDGEPITIRRGLAIYKTHAGPYWYARTLNSKTGKYTVRSTKETNRIEARKAAEELAESMIKQLPTVPKKYSFKHYATRFTEDAKLLVRDGARNENYVRTMKGILDKSDWGLMRHFSDMDIRQITTRDYNDFMRKISKNYPHLKPSTKNSIMATFRNVMKCALNDGVITAVPSTPRTRQRDNPRPFFQFYPLVATPDDDEFRKLRNTAKSMALNSQKVRGIQVTQELEDLILFVVYGFVRPTTSELYELKHRDITIAQNPDRLILTIRRGKTGPRKSNTTVEALCAYRRIQQRNPNSNPDDYIFLPNYTNRQTASRIIQRQFNEALELAGIKKDATTQRAHTLYSLRHTGINMRLVHSEGGTDSFNLAKTAGTSVEQIERFYSKRLPPNPQLAKNLQHTAANLNLPAFSFLLIR